MSLYEQSFVIEGERGNNAFSYSLRGEQPRLTVPALVEGSLEDVVQGDAVVFEDQDEYGILQRCTGLAQLVRTSFEGVPMVVMDNHNHAFYFWMEAFLKGQLQKAATLIHIDAHRDSRRPPELFKGTTLEEAFEYTNFVLNVGNYIVPAQEWGLIGETVNIIGEGDVDEQISGGDFLHQEESNKILNVDLDFFAPEMSYIPFEKMKRYILAQAKKAVLITVCTSPFFIDQQLAIQRLRDLFGADPR